MKLSLLFLALFLLVLGAVMAFGLAFKYSALVIGGLAIVAGAVIFWNRGT